MKGTGQGPTGAAEAAALTTPAEPAAPADTTPAEAAAPAQPAEPAANPAAEGGPKGQPSHEQQIARVVAEALKPISEKLAAINGEDPASAKQAVADTQADIEAVNAKYAADAKSWAVERALLTSGCIDSVGAIAHIKMDGVEFAEDGALKGLDVEALKTSHPHLFQATTPAATVSTGAAGAGAPPSAPAKTIKEGLAQAISHK